MRIEELKVHFPTSQSRNAPMVKAVDGVTFDVPRNTIVGLVGESGSGKTTTGRALLRLFAPTAGRILFDGQDITNLSEKMLPWRRRMQIVFQDPYASLAHDGVRDPGRGAGHAQLAQNRRAARIASQARARPPPPRAAAPVRADRRPHPVRRPGHHEPQ